MVQINQSPRDYDQRVPKYSLDKNETHTDETEGLISTPKHGDIKVSKTSAPSKLISFLSYIFPFSKQLKRHIYTHDFIEHKNDTLYHWKEIERALNSLSKNLNFKDLDKLEFKWQTAKSLEQEIRQNILQKAKQEGVSLKVDSDTKEIQAKREAINQRFSYLHEQKSDLEALEIEMELIDPAATTRPYTHEEVMNWKEKIESQPYIRATLGSSLRALELIDQSIFEKQLTKHDLKTKVLFQSLKELIGEDVIIPAKYKHAILEFCPDFLDKFASVFSEIKTYKKNFRAELENGKLIEPSTKLSEHLTDLMMELMNVDMTKAQNFTIFAQSLLSKKTGMGLNTQPTTDGMIFAVTVDKNDLEGPASRELNNKEDIRLHRAMYRASEQALIDKDFLVHDKLGGLWVKNIWTNTPNYSQFEWKGVFVKPKADGTFSTEEKSAKIELSAVALKQEEIPYVWAFVSYFSAKQKLERTFEGAKKYVKSQIDEFDRAKEMLNSRKERLAKGGLDEEESTSLKREITARENSVQVMENKANFWKNFEEKRLKKLYKAMNDFSGKLDREWASLLTEKPKESPSWLSKVYNVFASILSVLFSPITFVARQFKRVITTTSPAGSKKVSQATRKHLSK